MESEFKEYIQDIEFNDICDKMAISTTSQIIIFKKVSAKKTEESLDIEKKGKDRKGSKSEEIEFNKMDQLKLINDYIICNDSDNKKNKLSSSRSLITIEPSKEGKKTNLNLKTKNKNMNSGNLFFEDKNNFKLDRLSDGLMKNFYMDNDFEKFKHGYKWEEIFSYNTDGPALRLQWASGECGNILACCAYNKLIYIFKEEKNEIKSQWKSSKIKNFQSPIEDISFLPRKYSLALASITTNGFLKIFTPSVYELNYELKLEYNLKSNCSCLSCNPSIIDDLTIVVGCRKRNLEKYNKKEKNDNLININNDLIKILLCKKNKTPIVGNIKASGHDDDITDVDWANQNGRMYHMICSTSKGGKFIISEINLLYDNINNNNKINEQNFFNHKIIFEFKHNKPLWRCSFNNSGIMACCIDEDGDIFVFLKIDRDKFIKLDISTKK